MLATTEWNEDCEEEMYTQRLEQFRVGGPRHGDSKAKVARVLNKVERMCVRMAKFENLPGTRVLDIREVTQHMGEETARALMVMAEAVGAEAIILGNVEGIAAKAWAAVTETWPKSTRYAGMSEGVNGETTQEGRRRTQALQECLSEVRATQGECTQLQWEELGRMQSEQKEGTLQWRRTVENMWAMHGEDAGDKWEELQSMWEASTGTSRLDLLRQQWSELKEVDASSERWQRFRQCMREHFMLKEEKVWGRRHSNMNEVTVKDVIAGALAGKQVNPTDLEIALKVGVDKGRLGKTMEDEEQMKPSRSSNKSNSPQSKAASSSAQQKKRRLSKSKATEVIDLTEDSEGEKEVESSEEEKEAETWVHVLIWKREEGDDEGKVLVLRGAIPSILTEAGLKASESNLSRGR